MKNLRFLKVFRDSGVVGVARSGVLSIVLGHVGSKIAFSRSS